LNDTINLKKNYLVYLIILMGLILRLIFPSDMEWKGDEQWMYEQAQLTAKTHVFPDAGMESGGGLVNPGMSLAVFAAIAEFTHNPVQMNHVVMIVNVVAILCFLLFALFKIPEGERSVWLWGIALASVSPLAVLFSRKIWAQDLLPMLSFIIILTNNYRRKPWGAFIWGLSGALIGQIHMSGFFFAAGLFLFTVIYDYYNGIKFRWLWWLLGSAIGSVPIYFWIHYIMQHPQITNQNIMTLFQFNFFIYWFIDSQGINTTYSLRKEFWQFIKEPVIGGLPTYLVAVVHLFLLYACWFTLKKVGIWTKDIFLFIKKRRSFRDIFINISITKFYLFSILLGLGVMLTFSCICVQPHYLICAFPFMYIFIAVVLRQKKKIMIALIVAQLFITLNFLHYIHKNNGAPGGDYKVVYREQVK